MGRWIGFANTIRGQVLVAFVVMAGLVGLVGLHANYRIAHGGDLVAETYDGSLMTINYARAAATDFALMQLAAEECAAADRAGRAAAEERLAALKRSLLEDLEIAKERSTVARTDQAADRVAAAVEAWDGARLAEGGGLLRERLLGHVAAVDRALELLVNYTAGDGFAHRQHARDAVAADFWLNNGVMATALVFSAVVAWLLSRHIVRQVAAASAMAGRIALGDLQGPIPAGGRDELGALLSALSVMRGNLRAMMEREVSGRQSAQGRLLDAMESSREGIVVVDADGRVVLANDQALAALGVVGQKAGHETDQGATPGAGRWPALAARLPNPDMQGEVAMPGGRWINVSRSPTRDGGFIAVIADISALKEQGARLAATNLRLDTALDNMTQGLCLFDAAGRLAVVNRRYSELFGFQPGDVRLGLTYEQLVALRVSRGAHAAHAADVLIRQKMAVVRSRGSGSFSLAMSDGRVLSAQLRPAPEGGWAMTYEDVTERKRAETRLAHLARHDSLTGLPNRAFFTERMEEALAGSRTDGLAVLCLDLDRFKAVNDTLGHAMGDLLLRTVADRLTSCMRTDDVICRVGGDEFTVIQAGPCTRAATIALAERIIAATNQPYDLDGRRASVGVSVGIAIAPSDGASPDVLLRNADMALYRAKAEGRGTWRFYEPGMDAPVRARQSLGHALRNALDNGELALHYQPIYDLQAGRVRAFEALLRWNSPAHGAVPPSEFIPLAEELGCMASLGRWVLGEACQAASRWPSHIGVSVNVSPAQFADGSLFPSVSDALRAAGLPAARLSLEITEHMLLSGGAGSLGVIEALHNLGVWTSLDDFGTGYSSLSYLAKLPINQIKIDQSFIRGLGHRGTDLIVEAVVGLANNLSLRTVAEGVETLDQVRWLADAGCHDIQGYVLSRPVAGDRVGDALLLRLPSGASGRSAGRGLAAAFAGNGSGRS